MQEVKKSLERLELSNKPKLVITKKLKNQIDFLHNKVGSHEWSGELITSEEGTINDLDNWTITAQDIYLADIGTPGFTGYEVDKGAFKAVDIIDLYDTYPELLEGKLKIHHIHTHHSMGAFFSGTDWENLEDRADVSNYFLMLIVNFKGDYCAKAAFKAKKTISSPTTLEFSNNLDGFKVMELGKAEDKEVLVVMNCEIVWEEPEVLVEPSFEERFNKVKEAIEAEKKAKSALITGGYKPLNQSTLWDDGDRGDFDNYRPKRKGHELTEDEWKGFGPLKFDLKHGRAYLNGMLTDTTYPLDFTDCFAEIKKVNDKLKTIEEFDAYIEEFDLSMADMYDMMFPYTDIQDYIDLLRITRNYLFPYKYNRLANAMLECIQEEIKLNTKEKATY